MRTTQIEEVQVNAGIDHGRTALQLCGVTDEVPLDERGEADQQIRAKPRDRANRPTEKARREQVGD